MGLKNSSTKIIPKHSVLIALAGQGTTRAKVAINEIDLCTNQSLASITPHEGYYYQFVFYNLENRYHELRKMSTGDVGRGGLNLSIIKSILIAFPPLKEQQKISKILNCIDEKIDLIQTQKKEFTNLKKGLMDQLLKGRVRVKL